MRFHFRSRSSHGSDENNNEERNKYEETNHIEDVNARHAFQ